MLGIDQFLVKANACRWFKTGKVKLWLIDMWNKRKYIITSKDSNKSIISCFGDIYFLPDFICLKQLSLMIACKVRSKDIIWPNHHICPGVLCSWIYGGFRMSWVYNSILFSLYINILEENAINVLLVRITWKYIYIYMYTTKEKYANTV